MKNLTIYAGIFIIDLIDWMVLATTDSNHPHEFKAVGGMGLDGETPRKIAVREAAEEARVQVSASTLVLVEEIPGRDNDHIRYFFLADKIDGALDKGATWDVLERNPMGHVVEKITSRWVPIKEFADKLYWRQHPAFGAILAELAKRNPSLLQSKNFCQMMERFPEPENTGVDGAVVD